MRNLKLAIGILSVFIVGVAFQNCGEFSTLSSDRTSSLASELESAPGDSPITDNVTEEEIASAVPPIVGDMGASEAPVNLRFTLRTSSWVELTWDAPSDGEQRFYRVYRDGVLTDTVDMAYEANGGQGAQRQRYERTRTFVDCNGGLDAEALCRESGGPTPGETHTYYVTAVDESGLQSNSSESIEVKFEPKLAAPKKTAPYQLVFEEEFADVSPANLSQNWFFKRLWDQEASRDVYRESPNAQQVINGENGFMIDPTDTTQAAAHNPFQASPVGLNLRAEPNNGRLATTSFEVNYDPQVNQNVVQNLSGSQYSTLTGLLRSKATFVNGYIEARIKLAGVDKFLSTFYLLNSTYFGANPPTYGEGEIDIMEYLGGDDAIYGTPERGRYVYQNYHYRSTLRNGSLHKMPGNRHGSASTPFFSDDFHTFGVLWENSVTIYFIDDVEVFRAIGPAVSTDPKYIILSLVAGGGWANHPDEAANQGPTLPAALEVDYIRIYQDPAVPNTMFDPGR